MKTNVTYIPQKSHPWNFDRIGNSNGSNDKREKAIAEVKRRQKMFAREKTKIQ